MVSEKIFVFLKKIFENRKKLVFARSFFIIPYISAQIQ